jgi:hypothetical protein
MRLALVGLLLLVPAGGRQASVPPAGPACDTVQTYAFPAPADLVRQYLGRMNDGQFLSRWEDVDPSSVFGSYWPWLRGAVLCPAQLPPIGPGVAPAVVVARYSAGAVELSGESAVVTVTFDELGRLERGAFTAARRQRSMSLPLRRTPWGWRVERHDAEQHVSVAAALRRIHLGSATQEQIRAASR